VEWPQAGLVYYPTDRLELSFSHEGREGRRRIVLRAAGPRPRDILRRMRR
jgi:hypothetical protein